MLFKDPLALYYLHTTHSISLEFLRAKFLGQFWRVIELSSLGVFCEVLGQNQRLVCRALLENSWATILEQSCSGILDLFEAFF